MISSPRISPGASIGEKFSPSSILLLLAGLGIRVYAAASSAIINLDGIFYINQAKSIYAGAWHNLAASGISYLPINSLLIIPFYAILHDWLIAARTVSVLFGFGAIIPVYLMARNRFSESICLLLTLLYCFLPELVSRSADVLKDPPSWFFLAWALYFFNRHLEHLPRSNLFLCSLSFCFAIWARIEISFLFLGTAIYLIFVGHKDRWSNWLIFISPVLLAFIGIAGTVFSGAAPLGKYLRFDQLITTNFCLKEHYLALQAQLAELAANQPIDSPLRFFLPEARNLLWLIAAIGIFSHAIESFFPLYFPFFLIGIVVSSRQLKQDRRLAYPLTLATISLATLYPMLLDTWIMESRWFGPLIFILAIPTGYGLEKICTMLAARWSWDKNRVTLLLAFFIFVCGLGKSYQPRDTDKIIFKEIGNHIVAREGTTKPITIAGTYGSTGALLWITFYANPDFPSQVYRDDRGIISAAELDEPALLTDKLSKERIAYVVFCPRDDPGERQQARGDLLRRVATRIGTWQHPDTGQIELYQINNPTK